MRTSSEVKQLAIALIIAGNKIKHAAKDSNNPHFRNDYASLESVIDATKQALLDQDVVVLQGLSTDGQVLETRLQHKSGEFIETDVKMLLSKNDMQGLGSAITYARRYALAAVMNISQADDDGNVASGKEAKKTTPKKSDSVGSSSNGKTYTGPSIPEDF
jgi:hypothetical protein